MFCVVLFVSYIRVNIGISTLTYCNNNHKNNDNDKNDVDNIDNIR